MSDLCDGVTAGSVRAWELARKRAGQLIKSVSSPQKASVLHGQDLQSLTFIASLILNAFVSCAFRSGGLCGITPDDIVLRNNSYWSYVNILVSRCAIDDLVVDRRFIPTSILEKFIHKFPVNRDWVETFIIEPANKCFCTRNSVIYESDSDLSRRYSGHTPRRTFAVFVRGWLHKQGIDVSRKNFPTEYLTRINKLAGWNKTSQEFFDYSEDWETYLTWTNLVHTWALQYIWTGQPAIDV